VKQRTARKEEAFALQGCRAGLVSRAVASVVDLGVLAVLVLAVLLFVAAARYVMVGPPFDRPSLPAVLAGPAGFMAGVAYLSYFWAATGRTPGMQLLGLRVVREGGGRLAAPWAVARAALCIVFPIGLLWVLVSRRNASIQDLVVRTAVVYDWAYRVA
jgi:uncharacterized RDD family membrane protein YckC